MIRRRAVRLSVRLCVLALAAVAATGCATFSDNDAIARVGDVELSGDELTDSMTGLTSASDPTLSALDDNGRANGDATRLAVGNWIRLQLLVASELGDQYTNDPASLGVTCLDVAIATDQADAEGIKARLDGGEAWDDVVGPIEAAVGYESKQACQPLDGYGEQLGEDVAARLGALRPGAPPQVVDAGGGGFAVIRIQDIADVDSVSLLSSVQATQPEAVDALLASASSSDIYVDPRIGAFDVPTINVVAVN